MTKYDLEKYDTLRMLRYTSRELERGLASGKEHLERSLAKTEAEKAGPGRAERRALAERSVEKVGLALEEVEIVRALAVFCEIMDADQVRTRQQMVRLLKENKWLRGELVDLQKRLRRLEDNVVIAEAEKQHHQFVYNMRNEWRSADEYATYAMGGDDDEDTDPEEEVPAKVKPVHNLCVDYIREKRYEVAMPLIEGSLAQAKGQQGESSNEVATLLSIMGKLHKEQGHLAEAQDCYDKSLKIREKVLGKEHNGTGIVLTNLAHVMFKRDNVKEAEKLAVQALKIREKTLGKTHVEVALLHAHLGTYYISLEKWNDCINHYKTAMGVYEQMFDSTDNLVIKGYTNMAKAYVKLKQNDKSAEMLQLVCKSFHQKNNLQNALNIFEAAQLNANGKGKVFTPESLMYEYGSYENVMDVDILNIMVEYFSNLNKPAVADILKEWNNSSANKPTAVVRQSSSSKGPAKSLKKKNSGNSQSSKKERSVISDFFKKSLK